MTDETTSKHHAWEHTDEDGVVWEYRTQLESESAEPSGWFVVCSDGTHQKKCNDVFSCGYTYRRRKQLSYATCKDPATGRECRVYFQEVEDEDAVNWEWQTADGGWLSTKFFVCGCHYRRKQAAE